MDFSYRINNCGINEQKIWKFGNCEDKISEINRIKQSLTNELNEISARRDEAHATYSELNQAIPKLRKLHTLNKHLEQIKF